MVKMDGVQMPFIWEILSRLEKLMFHFMSILSLLIQTIRKDTMFPFPERLLLSIRVISLLLLGRKHMVLIKKNIEAYYHNLTHLTTTGRV